jgi:apolipoprotein N-acyltransferase
VHYEPPALYNGALFFQAGRSPIGYDKQHLLPQFEGQLKPGTRPLVFHNGAGTLAAAVCKDMDFPATLRRYGQDGVGLVLVPAWDFKTDDWLHARMAIMRGVEDGFAIARAARNGLLTVSDRYGRVLAYRPSKSAPYATLLAMAPLTGERTLYDDFGDWFAWACLAGLLLLAASLLRRRDR